MSTSRVSLEQDFAESEGNDNIFMVKRPIYPNGQVISEVSLRSDGAAFCSDVFVDIAKLAGKQLGSSLQDHVTIGFTNLPIGLLKDTLELEVMSPPDQQDGSPTKQKKKIDARLAFLKWFDASGMSLTELFNAYYTDGEHVKVTLKQENPGLGLPGADGGSSNISATTSTYTGALESISETLAVFRIASADGDEKKLAPRKVFVPIHAGRIVQLEIQQDTWQDYHNQVLPLPGRKSFLAVLHNFPAPAPSVLRLKLQYSLEEASMRYRVNHVVKLENLQADSMKWSTEVDFFNNTKAEYVGVFSIIERKQDTLQTQTQSQPLARSSTIRAAARSQKRRGNTNGDEATAESAPRDMLAPAESASSQQVVAADSSTSGVASLEMQATMPTHLVLQSHEDRTRATLRSAEKVPCVLWYYHVSDASRYGHGDTAFMSGTGSVKTERYFEWNTKQLFAGSFLFSGLVKVMDVNNRPLHTGSGDGLWFDAWKTGPKQRIPLGPTESVLARRVFVSSRNDPKASTTTERYRVEYCNHSSSSTIQLKYIERFNQPNSKPVVLGVFTRRYTDDDNDDSAAGRKKRQAVVSEASLMDVAAPAGWLLEPFSQEATDDDNDDSASSSNTAIHFVPYVDECVDEAERSFDPYNQCLNLRLPAGSETQLSKPGRLVVYYEVTYTGQTPVTNNAAGYKY